MNTGDAAVERVFLMLMRCLKEVMSVLEERRLPADVLVFFWSGWYVTLIEGSTPSEVEKDS